MGRLESYLICRQGCYEAGEVTILTPYSGQQKVLEKALKACFVDVMRPATDEHQQDGGGTKQPAMSRQRMQLIELVRLATVDNFQGEPGLLSHALCTRACSRTFTGML